MKRILFEDGSCDRRWRRASCGRCQCDEVAALADYSLHRFSSRFARAWALNRRGPPRLGDPVWGFRLKMRPLAQFAGDKMGAFFMRTVECSIAVL